MYVSGLMIRALRVRSENSKVDMSAGISRKEFIAMITDRPLCIWGECFPVSEEEDKREKEEAEEMARLEAKEGKFIVCCKFVIIDE